MAARFWVGGTGTWDNTNTSNWATTSGGAGGWCLRAQGRVLDFWTWRIVPEIKP